jgi:wobble nucleotide-excising tRNase
MPPVTIEKLGRVTNVGLFKDCRAADNPSFLQYNLVYGFNGSGKTTLSRMFASLGAGVRNPKLPDDGSFEVQTSDGAIQSIAGDLEAVRGRILVFNADFVDENLLWKQGEARPVFYIGKEQAQLAQKLEETTVAIATLQESLKDVTERHRTAERVHSLSNRDAARDIAEQLGLGRRYDASNLVADYGSAPAGGYVRLTEKEQQKQRAILAQVRPLPKLDLVFERDDGLLRTANQCADLLTRSPSRIAVSDLQEHASMRNWIGEGFRYHEDHQLENCLFCGNALSPARLKSLETVIDNAFEQLMNALRENSSAIDVARSVFLALKPRLPRATDFSESVRDEIGALLDRTGAAIDRVVEILDVLQDLISKKSSAPHSVIEGFSSVDIEQLQHVHTDLTVNIEHLQEYIRSHNRDVDSFDSARAGALDSLKHHLLATGERVFRENASLLEATRGEKAEIEGKLASLSGEEGRLKQSVRSHGIAAAKITKMIHNYLGRRDLVLETAEEGYRLRRNGKLVRESLSEGEKTAIAICYFIATIEAENRKRQELIVVIDDPVSSLDTRALNYAVSILKAMTDGSGQVFVLTHNLQFMNEIRKWLKPRTRKELERRGSGASASAALLFLEVTQIAGPETRRCNLRELPKHIRDYESEYHYLLHLIFRFVATPDASEHFYLIPNALRKVLEIFLAFKSPGPDGLGSKVERLARGIDGMDPARVHALERLAQVESHADSLDDLIALSSVSVEEVRVAAETLLALMCHLDDSHYEQMKKLCG